MTPRNPWRRRSVFREVIHPVFWWLVFLVVMFGVVEASIDHPRKVDQQVQQVSPDRWLIA